MLPNWAIASALVSLPFTALLFVPWRISSWDKPLRVLDVPDRALAWLALFLGLQILVQQTTNYPYGVVYLFADDGARKAIHEAAISSNSSVYGIYSGMGVAVGAAYWFLFVGVLLAVSALVRGTVRDLRNARNEELRKGQDKKRGDSDEWHRSDIL